MPEQRVQAHLLMVATAGLMCQYPNVRPVGAWTATACPWTSTNTLPGVTAYTAVPSGAEMSMPKWNARLASGCAGR